MRPINADTLIADCQLAQKQADRHGREFANAFYSGGGEISTEWWCVEDMIENAPTVDAVEVVRCKDCARYEKKRGCNLLEGLSIATENCFCSYGERRDG